MPPLQGNRLNGVVAITLPRKILLEGMFCPFLTCQVEQNRCVYFTKGWEALSVFPHDSRGVGWIYALFYFCKILAVFPVYTSKILDILGPNSKRGGSE